MSHTDAADSPLPPAMSPTDADSSLPPAAAAAMSPTDVIWAVKNGDLEEVKSCLAQQGADVNKILVAGRKPIHFAADCGQHEVLEYLIRAGAEINVPDVYGITALLSAINEEHLECVKLLVAKGADKRGKTPDGISYMEVAKSPEIRELLK
ncbi:myotrophin [Rhinoraja longicauda]